MFSINNKSLRIFYKYSRDNVMHFHIFSESGKENYIVMLFNDESHTYDEVIETLTKTVPGCGNNQALHFATIVDKMVEFFFLVVHCSSHYCIFLILVVEFIFVKS